VPLLNYVTLMSLRIIITIESVNLLTNGFLQSTGCGLTTATKQYYECCSEMHRNKTYTLLPRMTRYLSDISCREQYKFCGMVLFRSYKQALGAQRFHGPL
jgi:hypothetical protein